MSQEQKQETPKFPSEIIDLPSGGKIYGKDSPLYDGKIEIKYMTAKEEDILTSQNLIKKGVVIDTLLNSLIMSPGVKLEDLLTGDKNAIMVASRILAYGPEYICNITDDIGNEHKKIFNLADCPFKQLPVKADYSKNEFDIELPISKAKVKFKLLTGHDEKAINDELESQRKIGKQIIPELSTRLKHSIVEIDGERDRHKIALRVDNMLTRDTYILRQEIQKHNPDIELRQEVEIGGDVVKVDIPMTTEFFWPNRQA
tara:strand:+ start:624 stop:1394 length:771 start_codon:yes stop_codon:yes gene_type:complete